MPPALWNHSKVVALPWGIAAGRACFDVNAARAASNHTKPEQLFHVGNFAAFNKGPPLRMIRARRWTGLLRARGFDVRGMQTRLNKTEYLQLLMRHKFCLAPPRGGYDSFRVWEILYMGRVPVIGHYLPDALLEGLPYMRVAWDSFGVPAMQKQWQQLQSQYFNAQKMWMPYWIKKILLHCLMVS